MKIRDLIEKLQHMNQNAEVVIDKENNTRYSPSIISAAIIDADTVTLKQEY